MVQGAGSIPAPDTPNENLVRGMINMGKINFTRPEWDELRTEPEFEAKIENPHGPDFVILVEKAGGGTIGRAYVGNWNAEIQFVGRDDAHWTPISTGMEHTHEDVAQAIAKIYIHDMDMIEYPEL